MPSTASSSSTGVTGVVAALDVDPVHRGLLRHPAVPERRRAAWASCQVQDAASGPRCSRIVEQLVALLAEPAPAGPARPSGPCDHALGSRGRPPVHGRDLVAEHRAGVLDRVAHGPARAQRHRDVEVAGRGDVEDAVGVGAQVAQEVVGREAAVRRAGLGHAVILSPGADGRQTGPAVRPACTVSRASSSRGSGCRDGRGQVQLVPDAPCPRGGRAARRRRSPPWPR